MNKETIRKSFNEAISRIDHLIIKHLLSPQKYEDDYQSFQNSYIKFHYENKPNRRIDYLKLILAFIEHCLLGDSADNISFKKLYEEKLGWIDLNCCRWQLGKPAIILGEKVVFVDEQFSFHFDDYVGNPDIDESEWFVDWPWDKVEAEAKSNCSEIASGFLKEKLLNCTIVSLEQPNKFVDERDKKILSLYNTHLASVGCRFVYVDDFIKEKVPQQVFEFFDKKRKELISYVEKVRTEDGLREIITNNWEKLRYDMAHFFEWYDVTKYDSDGFPVCEKYGITNFIFKMDINNELCINWLVLFLSSKYLFNCLGFVEMVDNTFIVSGFLKSIETLFVHLIIEHAKNNGYEPKVTFIDEKNRTKVININRNTVDESTVGKIENYVRESNKFITDIKFRSELTLKIEKWRNYVRNGYFHKHLIMSQEDLEGVKNKTIELTRFVLDYFYGGEPSDDVDDYQKRFLDISEEDELPF